MAAVRVSPINAGQLAGCSEVKEWLQPGGPPLLWVSGPCGVGKTGLIQRFVSFLEERGCCLSWLDLEQLSGGAELAAAVSRELAGRRLFSVVLDGLETLPDAAFYIQERLLPSLPADLRLIIIARWPPQGLWLVPPWRNMVRHLEVRALGVGEAARALADKTRDEEIARLYVQGGGRYDLLMGDCLKAPRQLVNRYLREQPAVAYRPQIMAAAHTWRFDRELLEEGAGPLLWNQMWEIAGLSFVRADRDGFQIDPVLREALLKEAPSHLAAEMRRHLSGKAARMTVPSTAMTLGLLNLLNLPCLDELLDERLPFVWHERGQVSPEELDSMVQLPEMSGHLISAPRALALDGWGFDLHLLLDPAESITGFLALAAVSSGGPQLVVGAGVHSWLGRHMLGVVARKVLTRSLEGQPVAVPASLGYLYTAFAQLGFAEVVAQDLECSGKLVFCDFTSRGILPWVREVGSQIGRPGQDERGRKPNIEVAWVRAALRRFHDDQRLLVTELAEVLGDNDSSNGDSHQAAERIRTRIRQSLARLSPEDARLVTTAYLTLGCRSDLSRKLGVSERSLYRRLQTVLRDMGRGLSEIREAEQGGDGTWTL